MTDQKLPSGTTVLLKGGRVFTPDADWHEPPQADIAIAGDKIVGIASSYRIENASNIETIDARDHLVLAYQWESAGAYSARGFRVDLISFGYPVDRPLAPVAKPDRECLELPPGALR